MAGLNFDARQVAPAEALDPVPAGRYIAQIIESELKPTSKNDGAYLALTLQILEGPHAGRKLFDRLNLQNSNQIAQEIAFKTLSAICHAVQVLQVNDSQELHGKPLEVKVSLRNAGTDQTTGKSYDASNEVKGYAPAGGKQASHVTPPVASVVPPVAPPTWQAPAAPVVPAWQPPAPPATQAWQPPVAPPPVVAPPPAWQPPATVQQPPAVVAPAPAAPVAWKPPVTNTPPAQKVRCFVCDHCNNVINDYQPIPCPKCGCPNVTEIENMGVADQFIASKKAGAQAPAAPVAPAAPADNIPPWQRKKA